MGGKRKKPLPRFLTAVADNAKDAEWRAEKLHQLAQPARGRPTRPDQMQVGMLLADLFPRTPRDRWRKTRRKTGTKADRVPKREACAVEALIGIYADRGEILTSANATRIIEQARQLIDATRGISRRDRATIEEAREIVASVARSKTTPVWITKQEGMIIRRAVAAIQSAWTHSNWDRQLLGQVRAIRGRVQVH